MYIVDGGLTDTRLDLTFGGDKTETYVGVNPVGCRGAEPQYFEAEGTYGLNP